MSLSKQSASATPYRLVESHRSVFPICQKHPQSTSQVTTQLSPSVLTLGCHPSSNAGVRTAQGPTPASLLIRNNQQRVYPSHPSHPIIPFQSSKCGCRRPRPAAAVLRDGEAGPCHVLCFLRKPPPFSPLQNFLPKVKPSASSRSVATPVMQNHHHPICPT